eukprot:COSAG05_NODE_2536_length_2932_cov_2.918814_2_plen_426_part_00
MAVMKKYNQGAAGGSKRTMMLGCSNSHHRANHRTPVWWTGDNVYDQLALGVQKTVDGGVDLKPYVHQDCAGHHGPGFGGFTLPDGSPNPWGHLGTLPYPGEVYARWLQYCSLGTVTRMHSAPSMSRLPWEFGAEAEHVAKSFLELRRSLAPTLIAAGRQVSLDGTPIVRRCDLEWPEHAAEGASSSAQYMLADDLLVRPIDPFDGTRVDNATIHTYTPPYNRDASVWLPPGEWHNAFTGQVYDGGQNISLTGVDVKQMPLFHRGGGAVITATQSDVAGWGGLVLHIWPTRASLAPALAVGQLAPPLTRVLYAPSVADPNGTAPPATVISKTENLGRFELSFEPSKDTAPQLWSVRVHMPVGNADANTQQAHLRCGESNVPLVAHAPSLLHQGPFAGHHAPPHAPGNVLEGSITVPRTFTCAFSIH